MSVLTKVAKLLANENIHIVRCNDRTASFNTETRVLRLPAWASKEKDVEELFAGHEVGHALYTTDEFTPTLKSKPYLKGYLNIIEDIRIEKFIKERYPGLKKIFHNGYRYLVLNDFFGTKTNSVDTYNLIDKINVYFKAPTEHTINFSLEEMAFVNRATVVKTIPEVIQLAEDIYNYSKEELEEREENSEGNGEFGSGGDEAGNSDLDNDGNENDSADSSTKIASALESKTEEASKKYLDSIISKQKTEYLELPTYKRNLIVNYKKILSELKGLQESSQHENYVLQFKSDTKDVVNFMIKEFEMRKAAQNLKRNLQSRKGSLSDKRLYSYRFNDDIFKKIQEVHDGKNHGMIFLLDWSGSMDSVLHETIKQLITLVLFCRKIKIPFRVFAFTTTYPNPNKNNSPDLSKGKISSKENGFDLLEFFSEKMTANEFNVMIKNLLNTNIFRHPGYGTGSTPLNASLYYMLVDYIAKFKKQTNVEKVVFVTLTDGSSDSCRTGYLESNNSNIIIDPVTKQEYLYESSSTKETRMILRMIRERYGIKVLGFYIGKKSHWTQDIIKNNVDTGTSEEIIKDIEDTVKKTGAGSFKGVSRDELFFISSEMLTITKKDLIINSSQSMDIISKNFKDSVEFKRLNRILLCNFIKHVA